MTKTQFYLSLVGIVSYAIFAAVILEKREVGEEKEQAGRSPSSIEDATYSPVDSEGFIIASTTLNWYPNERTRHRIIRLTYNLNHKSTHLEWKTATIKYEKALIDLKKTHNMTEEDLISESEGKMQHQDDKVFLYTK